MIVLGGTYRLDFLPNPKLVLEVDGYAYHSSPAAKASDSVRLNRLQLNGLIVLRAEWIEVQRHPDRLKTTLLHALGRDGLRP